MGNKKISFIMRARITFSKSGPLRYIGHLDLQTLWERAARRAGLPLAYSNGFHPQAKIYFAAALPLGFSSRAEVMDMRLEVRCKPGRVAGASEGTRCRQGSASWTCRALTRRSLRCKLKSCAAEYEVGLIEQLDRAELQALY